MPLLLFWVVLFINVPASFSRHLHAYTLGSFLIVLAFYFVAFRLPRDHGILLSLGLTMTLLALTLSFKWTSGFSDNMVIGGLLPYKDGKNYYWGANLILDGLPVVKAGQATERPLFPGFLAGVLSLTGQNLKITLAIVVQLVGVGLYLSARQVRNSFGGLAAGMYAALMYFYIQPLIGYTMSEMLGFIAGCIGFTMLWLASNRLDQFNFLLGILALMVAVSARAGAFFIFPMLILWVGWIFRGEKRFSVKAAVSAFILVLIGFLLVNSIYARLLGIPPGNTFGNLSYALYGQVRGGTGWHSAIEDLGTRDASIVYRAALEYFLDHPISLFIGFAKSYRDFFLIGDQSIFPFWGHDWHNRLNLIPWLGTIILLVMGLVWSFREIRSNLASLLVAGFTGVFLSIPFLPPIDGGARFYASTMPFFFILPAVGVWRLTPEPQPSNAPNGTSRIELTIVRMISTALLVLTIVVPVIIHSLGKKPAFEPPTCLSGQEPFVIDPRPGSYLNLLKADSFQCGVAPDVCLDDFEKNNIELSIDDFYQMLASMIKSDDSNVRIIPAADLIYDDFHYFYIPYAILADDNPSGVMTGCAVEIKTIYQSIYRVESIQP